MGKQDIDIRTFTGDKITPDLSALMYRYYLNTNERYGPWAARFLNGDFFQRIFQGYRHRLLVIITFMSPSSVSLGMLMLLVKDRHLVGRYWGCEAVPNTSQHRFYDLRLKSLFALTKHS